MPDGAACSAPSRFADRTATPVKDTARNQANAGTLVCDCVRIKAMSKILLITSLIALEAIYFILLCFFFSLFLRVEYFEKFDLLNFRDI